MSEVRWQKFPAEPVRFHEYANLFPMLSGEAAEAFEEDVRQNGVREPIVFYEGFLLDGRNRYMAARACHQDYPYVEFVGGDALAFVVSLNLARRHLNESQRSQIAAKIANIEPGDFAGNQYVPTANLQQAPVTQAAAAQMLNVSERSVANASRVLKHGVPELVAAVEAGEVSVSAAAEVSSLPPERQSEVVAEGPEEVREVAREVREERRPNRTQFTGNNEWYTPPEYVELVRSALGTIDLDPASSEQAQKTVLADRYFTEEDNGLEMDWGGRVWLNPPYAQPAIGHFADKMVSEWESGRVSAAIVLTHNYTDTAWFQKLARTATALCFTRGRVKFVSPNGEIAAPTQGQAFFYFGHDLDAFTTAFADTGFVVQVRA